MNIPTQKNVFCLKLWHLVTAVFGETYKYIYNNNNNALRIFPSQYALLPVTSPICIYCKTAEKYEQK